LLVLLLKVLVCVIPIDWHDGSGGSVGGGECFCCFCGGDGGGVGGIDIGEWGR